MTGLGNVPLTMPRRLGEILREPVLVGAAGGGVLVAAGCCAGARRSAPRPACVAVAAFCVLAAAGLPILGRYLLLPAAILAIFCGAGAFGWVELPRGRSAAARAGRRSARFVGADARLRARRRWSRIGELATRSRARTRSRATSTRS